MILLKFLTQSKTFILNTHKLKNMQESSVYVVNLNWSRLVHKRSKTTSRDTYTNKSRDVILDDVVRAI